MKCIRIFILFYLIFNSGIVFASVDPCPLVTEETIYGEWEAIYQTDTIRVFRIELLKKGESLLTHGHSRDSAFVSVFEEMKIDNGHVTLKFRDISEGLVGITYYDKGVRYTSTGEVLIKGIGRVCRTDDKEHGVLDVELIMEPHAPTPTVWKLKFFKSSEELLIDYIKELSDAAKRSASDFRKK